VYETLSAMVVSWVYYRLKPFIPWRARMALRRWLAARIRKSGCANWPICEASGQKPGNFPGWPTGKRFAFVLTHDVESQTGLERIQDIVELERQLGFKSSFNLVPEGSYDTPVQIRHRLRDKGLEVGVHDLRHDGKLFDSRAKFREKAARINHYLREWHAVGFRSAFMHRKLSWLHDLEIAYDCSTFDTDPFEPQPDGVHTIFPFWCAPENGKGGYVELPYTLPQDSTLFLVLEEQGIDIWRKKLDWIVARGGMALLNVHPDYTCFNGKPRPNEYSAQMYANLLEYVRSTYAGQYWQALPHEVADYVKPSIARPAIAV
jgi:hypothetical protein